MGSVALSRPIHEGWDDDLLQIYITDISIIIMGNPPLYEQHLIAILHRLANHDKITKDEANEIFHAHTIYSDQSIKDTEYIWKKQN